MRKSQQSKITKMHNKNTNNLLYNDIALVRWDATRFYCTVHRDESAH